MVQFWYDEGKNCEAVRRRWTREFGQGHVPTRKTIKYNVDKFLQEGNSTTGFENQHIYVPKVTKSYN